MEMKIKALIEGKWQHLPVKYLGEVLDAVSLPFPIVASVTYEGGDQQYYASTEEWVKYYQDKGEIIEKLPSIDEAEMKWFREVAMVFDNVLLEKRIAYS